MENDRLQPAYTADCDAVKINDELIGTLYGSDGDRPRPTALLLHGIPGSEKNVDIAYRLRDLGWHALILCFRGAWGSGGDYDMRRQPDEVAEALNYLLAKRDTWQVDAGQIAVIGNSLGSRAAIVSAARDPRIRAVVSVSGIADFDELILSDQFFSAVVPFLRGSTAQKLRQQWLGMGGAENPYGLMGKLTQPTLLMHGTADEVVPLYHAEALQYASGNKAELLKINDANHTYARHRSELVAAVTGWLERWQQNEPTSAS
ncbi:MAG: prolyl oligopeptidase family serine peptidase [Anaerolineae bacterium]|nr:prolyl oligopeptidase family serine peptidase [Anaerolineae bacterium]